MAERIPLQPGQLAGEGHWSDQRSSGRYTVAFAIAQNPDGSLALTAQRSFYDLAGAAAGTEHSVTTLRSTFACFFDVQVAYENATHAGTGYCYGNQAHYGFDVSPTARVEYTWKLGPAGQIEGMGSSTNEGNFTSWSETLA